MCIRDSPIPYHTDIMESFDGIDMDAAGRVSGSGFYYLLGDIARLHEAVLAYGRDFKMCIRDSACGVFCDLLLPSPISCFYTLILPFVGLAAGLLSQSLIPAGYLCSAAAALPAYLLTGIFHCIVLWAQGHPAWGAACLLYTSRCV